MKNRFVHIPVHLLVSLVFLVAGCTGKRGPSEENALLPGRLVVFSPVPFTQEEGARSPGFHAIHDYNASLLNQALTGQLTVYNSITRHEDLGMDTEMEPEFIAHSLNLEDPDPPGRPEEIASRVSEILSGFFVEEWSLGREEFVFRKKVIQYQPVWHKTEQYFDEITGEVYPEEPERILLFGVSADSGKDPSDVAADVNYLPLVKDFRYELELYNQPFQDILLSYVPPPIDQYQWAYYNFMYFKDFDRDRFVDLILDKALSGEIPAYDPADLTTIMDIPAIHEAMMADSIFLPVRNDDGSQSEAFHEVYLPVRNINSVIFIEDWYYHRKSMVIVKVVKGIIPVLHYEDPEWPLVEGGEIERIPLFAVLFGKEE